MVIVTGGAGFIGSALIAELNHRGRHDIVCVDDVDHPRKQRNLDALVIERRIGISEFVTQLTRGTWDREPVSGVIHLGACSDTREQNLDFLRRNNIEYSQAIITWCASREIPCVYASSAATYGDGTLGFSDAPELFDRLRPLNPYGRSKLAVDLWARDNGYLKSVAGVRYFNVFGPNEWHKGPMRSVVLTKLSELLETGRLTLFRSYLPQYGDGAQERDFVYVIDAVDVTLWLLERTACGVFNVGGGEARTWNALATAMFSALSKPVQIEYIEMPPSLQTQYQYHTCADITKLRAAGYLKIFSPLETSVRDYICNYLLPDRHLGKAIDGPPVP